MDLAEGSSWQIILGSMTRHFTSPQSHVSDCLNRMDVNEQTNKQLSNG